MPDVRKLFCSLPPSPHLVLRFFAWFSPKLLNGPPSCQPLALSNRLRVIMLHTFIFVLKGVGVHEVAAVLRFMRFRFNVDRSVTDMRASRAWVEVLREMFLACVN